MFEVQIKFDVVDKKNIGAILDMVKSQIEEGEFHSFNNPKGYCANKYNNIGIWNKEMYTIGTFKSI